VPLAFKVRWARFRMSSLEHSREIRTSSHNAPPATRSLAFTSAKSHTSDAPIKMAKEREHYPDRTELLRSR
jgi:hypothetical protein